MMILNSENDTGSNQNDVKWDEFRDGMEHTHASPTQVSEMHIQSSAIQFSKKINLK